MLQNVHFHNISLSSFFLALLERIIGCDTFGILKPHIDLLLWNWPQQHQVKVKLLEKFRGLLASKWTNLCLNMRAGSMLAEVNRTTCLISLAIILSFSKFTRPSTLESLPERTNKYKTHTHTHTCEHTKSECEVSCQNFKGDKWFIFWDICKILTIVLSRIFKVKISFFWPPSCHSSRDQSGVCLSYWVRLGHVRIFSNLPN